MKQTQNNSFDSQQVLSVIEQYSMALDLLDAYDHQTMERPKGNEAAYVLTYEECMHVIACMRFGKESDLFGKEKDDSFKGSIGNIYQSFAGMEVYPTLEAFSMATRELQRRCSCIFLIRMVHCLPMVRRQLMIIHW